MMKRNLKYIFLIPALFAVVTVFIFAVLYQKNSDKDYREVAQRSYRIFSPACPLKADFAGEKMPLDLFYVHESLDREIMINTFMHASTILMFKRANRWFPLIEPILKKNKVPDDFKFLALAESNFYNVVSPSKAEGFWQFLKPTAIHYGLEVNEEVDERYNVSKATEAACKYFLESYEKYGNWTLVAASFNRGQDGISDALENQKAKNFYDLYLNEETSRYIYRIVAIKEIYGNPVQYGLYLRASDFYPVIPTYTIEINTPIRDLPEFALKNNLSVKVFRDFNPWLRKYTLTNKLNKKYQIVLPKEGAIHTEYLQKNLINSDTYFHDTLKINEIH
ncbi:MAG: lytic transglycosylase domain-containing protein [Bacteroidetes bacterium]|nr:lytic transglycosylase domain-containing protein [Bacteroidota bacterium]